MLTSQGYHLLLCHRCRIDEEVTHKAWLNRSNILFTGTDKWSLDKRVTLVNSNNSDFSIHIDKVQVTDEGPYTCTFQANNMPRIAHVYLIVQVPARIVNISKNVSVNEGENVNLYCLAVGRPEPTVIWKDQKFSVYEPTQYSTIPQARTSPNFSSVSSNPPSPPPPSHTASPLSPYNPSACRERDMGHIAIPWESLQPSHQLQETRGSGEGGGEGWGRGGGGRAQRNSKKLPAICPHYSETAWRNCREGEKG
ncbi:hypothetical protein INR49_001486 [Caranx melampygus]|nr:hypothetical protein INR49_001486 [Caranx melampygus]